MKNSRKYAWPLADSPFTILDRAKISWWILSQDRYTMGAKVEEIEEKFSQLSGSKALMVANGSIANHLVFELWKFKNPGVKPVVVVPAVTWSSSITPAMMAGMDIVFCDVNLSDFSFDYVSLEACLEEQSRQGRRIIIWPTALIGWSPDMKILHGLASKFGADLYLDACENTLAKAKCPDGDDHILNSADMVTTSCYLSHYVCSVEGGFVFFKNRSDFDLAKMLRNHGMIRSLPSEHPLRREEESANPTIDPRFLFSLAGSNFRPSDVHAIFGLMDLQRADQMLAHRKNIYWLFASLLDKYKYYIPDPTVYHAPFCLPIFRKNEDLQDVKEVLEEERIESRPIIGSNLLRQPAFKRFGCPEDFPNAEWIHFHGCYVGLHHGVTESMVERLTDALNIL